MNAVENCSMSQVVENLANLMQTLDDAWNAGPKSPLWETFRKRHTEDVAVYWPGQPEPTRGRRNHDLQAVEFFKTFPDNHLINRPDKDHVPARESHVLCRRFLCHIERANENT